VAGFAGSSPWSETPSAVGAAELRASVLGLVRKSGFRAYFRPVGGQGYGASGFA